MCGNIAKQLPVFLEKKNYRPKVMIKYSSVQDVDSSACDTESEDKRANNRLNPKAKLFRSKSSSPNRQVSNFVSFTFHDILENDDNLKLISQYSLLEKGK